MTTESLPVLVSLGECDVLVCGNKKVARAEVITLLEAAGMRGFPAGITISGVGDA